jgi:tetratricopeptide (TPR) repeat protein
MLGTEMALQPGDIYPYLEKAKKLNPSSPEPYRYIAIHTVEANFQYATAIKNLQEFLKRDGDPVFGNNYLGFANMRLKNYRRAIQYFEESLKYSKAQENQSSDKLEQIMYSYEKLYICYDNIKESKKSRYMLNLMRKTSPDHWRTQMYRSQQ